MTEYGTGVQKIHSFAKGWVYILVRLERTSAVFTLYHIIS